MEKWSREAILHFIYVLQQHECLYNMHSHDYLSKHKRAHAMFNIQKEMQRYVPRVQEEDLKRKIKTLRTQYAREWRMIQKHKETNSTKAYAPKLWCFDDLKFLKDHIQSRSVEKTSPLKDDDSKDPNIFDENTESSCSTNARKSSSKSQRSLQRSSEYFSAMTTEETLKELKSLSETIKMTPSDDNEYDCFARSIACQLKKLPEIDAQQSMVYIQTYLVEQRLKSIHSP